MLDWKREEPTNIIEHETLGLSVMLLGDKGVSCEMKRKNDKNSRRERKSIREGDYVDIGGEARLGLE